MIREEDDFMEGHAACTFKEIVTSEPRLCQFSRNEFARLHVALQRRLIKLILVYLDLQVERLDFSRLELMRTTILQTQTSNLQLNIQEGFYLIREYDNIRFQASITAPKAYLYPVDLQNGTLFILEAGFKLGVTVYKQDSVANRLEWLPNTAEEVYLELDQLELPLFVRSRQVGDRIEPHGLNGSKKVKDMFIDAKVPPSLRDTTPLLVDTNGLVLWIVGLRRSKHAPVTNESSRLLHMKLLL
ncbi:tRNA(Ile)-lysidine synthase [compost metagenome]